VGDTNSSVRLCGLYLPNGNPAPGPKYDYKLALDAHAPEAAPARCCRRNPLLLTGDFNIFRRPKMRATPERMAAKTA